MAIIYDDSKSFNEQTAEVQDFIRNEVIDQTAEPFDRDQLGRPLNFHFEFTDGKPKEYLVNMLNVYISNKSWALKDQLITVTAK